jgi:hypothetical protein
MKFYKLLDRPLDDLAQPEIVVLTKVGDHITVEKGNGAHKVDR